MHGYIEKEMSELDKKIISFFVDELQRPDIVIISQMDFGHTYPQHIIPYGRVMTINCDERKISVF